MYNLINIYLLNTIEKCNGLKKILASILFNII